MLSLDEVKSYLETCGWKFEDHDGLLVVPTVADHTRIRVNIGIYPEGKCLSIYCFFDLDSKLVLANKEKILEILNDSNFCSRYAKCFLEYSSLIQIQTILPVVDSKVGCKSFFECLQSIIEMANDIHPKIKKYI